MWYLNEKNRIFGLRAEGKHPLDVELIQQICEQYESV
jgi:hypothetical protein